MAIQLSEEQKRILQQTIKDKLDQKKGGAGAIGTMVPQNSNYKLEVEPADMFNVLDPNKDDAVNNTYIVVSGVPATYLVSFYWNGDYSIEPVTSPGEGEFKVKVPRALVIAAATGGSITVIYAALGPEGGAEASEPLLLTVKKYIAPVYPKALFTDAKDGVLDLSKLTGPAKITLAAWPGQTIGQKLWLTVLSTPPITVGNWNPLVIDKLGPQNRVITLKNLQEVADGSTLTLKLEISEPGEDGRSPFSESPYIIKKTPDIKSITIDKVTDSKGNPIANGGTTSDTSVTVYGSVS